MQKSDSSSRARFLKMPHPSFRVSKLESLIVCSRRILTSWSRNSAFRDALSSIRVLIARAADDLVFSSALWRSFRRGSKRCSRNAANLGSDGGFADGFWRFLFRIRGLDLPMVTDTFVLVLTLMAVGRGNAPAEDFEMLPKLFFFAVATPQDRGVRSKLCFF